MKLVIRIDDVGYSNVCNIGAFETLEHGIATSADVMLDTPGTVDALERLRHYPWISIGWHTHFWGTPVLGASEVPSMYDKERDGFRTDLYTAPDIVYEEALAECRAQVQLCKDILGRVPDVGGLIRPVNDSPFARALLKVHEEFDIVTDFMGLDLGPSSKIPGNLLLASPKWQHRKIFMRGLDEYCEPLRRPPLQDNGWTDSITAVSEYDPIRFYLEDHSKLLNVPDDTISVHAWHPGYLDHYVLKHGDYTPGASVFKDIRIVDAHALCSDEVRSWIQCNHIELINMRDALFGTSEYQAHLQEIASNLVTVQNPIGY